MEIKMMTLEEQEAARQYRLNESGTEPPCPRCGRERVSRSDYIRCNPCGLNWEKGENLDKDPRIERHAQLIRDTQSGNMGKEITAKTARNGSTEKE
jgi:hypothetical protein